MSSKRREIQYVFGYGSLVDAEDTRKSLGKGKLDYLYCYLNGFKRDWKAAYNSILYLPGNSNYFGTRNRRKIDYSVCFLNVTKDPTSRVFGILFKVDDRDLKVLDRREVVYNRVDVTSHFSKEIIGLNSKVWVYTARNLNREIYDEGLKDGSLVIPKYYAKTVLEAYFSIGRNKLIEFINDTEDPGIKVRELWWID